ncbi:MAG TPA: thioredoxin domain-containing protein [Pyrinomonadaceae bacterium]|nr:thioredoxin domain-containing protein [Pyrinomonadaceae bacterium]
MRKVFYALFLTLALCAAASPQTRRTTQPGARTSASTGAAKPATQQKPAATTPAPQQTQANSNGAASAVAVDCGCEAGPLPDVLATVNGIKITKADLSPEVQQQVQELQQAVVNARKAALDDEINDILVEAEAKKRGVSVEKLLQDEVKAKTVEPTEAEALAFFNQNKAQIEQQAGSAVEFAQIKDQVVAYVRAQRQQERAMKFVEGLRAASAVKVISNDATPPRSDADRARVLAAVGGRNITSGDIEDDLLPNIVRVQQQVYILRKNDVDLKINNVLLSQEAQKRGMTERALLETEVTAKVPVITEAQALDFYNKNKAQINGDFTTVKYQLIEYLQSKEAGNVEGAFAGRLRNAASVQTFLTPPPAPAYRIATDDQPEKGNPKAAVTLVEFTDYQCPSCAQEQPIIERLINEYGDRVRFVFRDFPLQQHADAEKAAEAAEAAREQGKYWDFTAILFRNQSQLKPEMLKQYAGVIGLDRAKFDAALDSGKFADKVRRDLEDGQRIGVTSTPSLFVNGSPVTNISYESVKATLDAALKSSSKP